MSRRHPVLLTLVLAACAKTDPPPAPTPVAAPAPAPAPAPAVPAGPSYIVWTSGAGGYESTWLAPAAGDTREAVATRAQATVFAGDTLWGFEWSESRYREVSCEDHERDKPGEPGPVLKLPYLELRGLAGVGAGERSDITSRSSDYMGGPDAGGLYTMIGEHWGRTIELTGGAGSIIMVTDCQGGYGCGAHGDAGCVFIVQGLSGKAAAMDLNAATAALEPATREMIKEWRGDGDDSEVGEPTIQALSLRANDGDPLVDYLYVADVPYSGTAGEWGSYTQSRDHLAPAVPALGLPEVPAPVQAWLHGKGKETRFGWSVVPADAPATVLAAFRDPSTIPAKPSAEPAGTDPADQLRQGRALTRKQDYDGAIASFTAAITADASLARAWSGRGYARLLAGDLDGATADLTHALGLDPSPKFQAAIHFNLAETAEKRGDRAAAVALYEKAQALARSKAALQRIRALKAAGTSPR